jgi:hypothetical protein
MSVAARRRRVPKVCRCVRADLQPKVLLSMLSTQTGDRLQRAPLVEKAHFNGRLRAFQ